MIKALRVVSWLEGLSYLGLLGIGVPLKYINQDVSWVKALGMPHGLLFIAYIVLAYVVSEKRDWNSKTKMFVFIASIIPFATFYVEYKFLKK